MSKLDDKIRIIEIIKEVALKYDAQMVGRTFLYVFEGRAIEVVFRRKDFMHLTGVDANMSGEQFFKNVISGKLKANQIYFSHRHPYDLCVKKVSQLPKLISVTDSEIFILEDTQTMTFTYKFGLTDLESTVCLSKDVDKNGNNVSRYYIARSLRAEDSFDKAVNAFEVQFIFSKPGESWLYDTVMYADDRCNINTLPKQVLDMLDNKLKKPSDMDNKDDEEHTSMKFIGITGGVGAGKSEVLAYLKKKNGVRVMLADEIAHELMEPGTACYEQIRKQFPELPCGEDGRFDRTAMAQVIFSDEQNRQKMNAIVHPAVKEYVRQECEKERANSPTRWLFLEAALLIEEGYGEICNELWYIYADEQVRRKRLAQSRGYSDARIDGILASQLTEEEYRKSCQVVIDNGGDLIDTYRILDELMHEQQDEKADA